jgi:hypothetical protein
MNANSRLEDFNVSAEQDFPALPATATSYTARKSPASWEAAQASDETPLPAGTTSWADQVESQDKIKW